jgi:hypothetical protein
MSPKVQFTILSLALSLVSAACSSTPGGSEDSQAQPMLAGPTGEERELGKLIYLGAQTAAERAGVLAKDRPIVVATMVSIDDFNKSSTFGRLASQLISNRLAQRGYVVKDVTYMRALTLLPGTGELVLSRDASRLSASVNAQAVVAGTYAVAGREIYLNIRFLKPDDGQILSSADVVIPLDHNTETLVAAAN